MGFGRKWKNWGAPTRDLYAGPTVRQMNDDMLSQRIHALHDARDAVVAAALAYKRQGMDPIEAEGIANDMADPIQHLIDEAAVELEERAEVRGEPIMLWPRGGE